MIPLLLSQQCVTAQGPSHPAPFHCSIFANRQEGHLMHTHCYQNRKEPNKSPLRVRLFSLLTLYCPQKAPLYLRSSHWSTMQGEMDGSIWGAEHLEKLAFPYTLPPLALFFSGCCKNIYFCQDKLVRSTQNILGLCETFFPSGKFYSIIAL